MFGLRQGRSTSERALVPANEPESANDDSNAVNDDLNEGPSGMTYADLVSFVRRKKCMVACVTSGILVLVALVIVTICATASSPAPVIPTTPAPITTSSTTPTSTTTPTTTPSTTTSTSTTTATTTTTSTTTSPTTTKPTTTTPSTTTSTSTTTTTTTSTTPSTTTTHSTTTTEKPTTSTDKPGPPSPPAPTTRPIPPHPESLAPKTLLEQVGFKTNYTQVKCAEMHPPTWRYILSIEKVNETYTGESDRITNAETAAAMLAAHDLLHVTYNYTMPPAPHPCFPNVTTLHNLEQTAVTSATISTE